MVYNFNLLNVNNLGNYVVKVSLNRPKKYNALNMEIWGEIGLAFEKLDTDPECRVIILEGEGKHFTAGLDLSEGILMDLMENPSDQARKSRLMLPKVRWMQKQFTLIEKCSKPVIAAIHGYCIGGGIDIITACDIRHCSSDASFCIKEVDVGLAADVGTLNRIPKVCGNESWVKEIAFTARTFGAQEALQQGLISKVYQTREEMQSAVRKLAEEIAQKSPVAVQGTKINLNYSRDHTVDESLEHVAIWNASQLFTDDIIQAGLAVLQKQPPPPFSKL